MTRYRTDAALAAQMIRKSLKAQGLVVQVRSRNFSMGDAVDVHMTDQRPEIRALVEEFCGKFQYGHFDGMDDSYHSSNRRSDIPQAKYVHVHNQMSDAMRESIYQHCRTRWHGGDALPATYTEAGRSNMRFQGEWIDMFVNRQFSDAESPFWRDRPLTSKKRRKVLRAA